MLARSHLVGLSNLIFHIKQLPEAGKDLFRNFNALNFESGSESPHYDGKKKKQT